MSRDNIITNQLVEHYARSHGFDLVGFSPAEKLNEEIARLNEWLECGFQAGMKYMQRNIEKREDISLALPGAKSVISLGMNYFSNFKHEEKPGTGKISRYAWSKDYHLIIWERSAELIDSLRAIDPGLEAKAYVDTGPVMDKAWAVHSGIGWMGKNSNIINRNFGSWFFIANIITNREFEYDQPAADRCGSCSACIDSCPTGAIVKDYVIDSNKCISYLTIENKKEISEEFRGKFDNWIFGCDICQDVCPWNKKFSKAARVKNFLKEPLNQSIVLSEIEVMTNSQFKKRFKLSPINRARLKGLKRNVEFIKK